MKYMLLLFTFFVQALGAQDKKMDSINNLIAHAQTDTARINLLNKKALNYTENSIDSAINIAAYTIKEAQRIHYPQGEANAYLILGSALTSKSSFVAGAINFKAAEQLYKQISDSAGLNKVNDGFGMYYGMQSKYDSSIIFFKKTIVFDEINNMQGALTSAYQNIAVSYTMMADYPNALLYQSKALKLAESRKSVSDLAYINLNMANSYSNVADYAKCEELNFKAIQYAQQAHIKNVELYGYANLASNYSVLEKPLQSYDYAMKAVILGKQLGDYAIVSSSLSRAGVALASQKKFSDGEKLTMEAMRIADSVGAPLNIFQTYVDMGFVKKAETQYGEAIKYYEKGFASIKDADIYDAQIGNSYHDLSEAYEKTSRYDKALAAFKTSKKISDSLKSRENIRRATELSMNYTFDKKREIEKIEQDKKDAITSHTRNLQYLVIAAFGLLGIFLLFGYIQQNKSGIKVKKAYAELKLTQAQLIQSEKMASLGELTAGIAHEIQNPLNFVNNFSEVNKELIEELKIKTAELKIEDQEVNDLLNDLTDNEEKINFHGKRADAIVKGMLQHSRLSVGAKEATDLNALCDEYLRLSYHGLRAKDKSFNADFKTDFDNTIGKINLVPQDIGRVLLNLYNNAFYAVREKQVPGKRFEGMVSVSTKKLGNRVSITVSDNGEGIPAVIKDKIFQPFFTTKPTGEGTGLGLSLSYDIVKAHGGEIKVESKEGEGTVFVITIPV